VLKTRLITAVILAPLFLLLVRLGSPYFDLLVVAIVVVMAREFTRMDGREGDKRGALIMLAAGVAVASVFVLGEFTAALAIVAVASVGLVVADQVAGRSGFALVQTAVIYAAMPALALLFVHRAGGYQSVFWLLAVVWMTDIGAYMFGRMIGGPKLAPRISPNKTWAGAIGGLGCGVLAGAALLAALDRPPWGMTLPLAALVSVFTQLGDLFESALKRRYQVKDSGGLLPGHGGVMDRFDGLWAAAPATAAIVLMLDGGVDAW
jgi:phosphatidate cytidylyltransferase